MKPARFLSALAAFAVVAAPVAVLAVLVTLQIAGGTETVVQHRQVVDPADPGPPISAPLGAVDRAEDQGTGDTDLHSETGISPTQARQNTATSKAQTSGPDTAPPIQVGASFQQDGCRTIPVVNYSTRNGTRPGLVVLHYTVSSNRAGWSDVLAIVNLFNNSRYQASSNYVIDAEGHCAYIVPETAKAWTQGSMNPWSACAIEQIGNQSDNGYRGPGLAKAARVVHDCAKRWGIPVRAGATRGGCSIVRTGVVDHNELGCGNNHVDITPFSTRPVIAAAAALGNPSPLTLREKHWIAGRACRKLRRHVRLLDARHRRGRPWRKHRSGARRQLVARAVAKRC